MKLGLGFGFALALIVALTGCGGAGGDAAGAAEDELTVFAASSLADAFEEMAEAFEAGHPGTRVVLNFGSSSQLAAQLAEGAAADVFASANADQMNTAAEAGRIDATPVPFVTNRLVVITPADNPARIESLADLARPGVRLLLAAPGVPVREYSDQLIAALAADPAYGAEFAEGVYANLASEEENVRQAAAKIALGEADAGIVYASDVTPDLAGQVRRIDVPDQYNVAATYPIARVAGSARPELAQEFIDFVLSEEGQDILLRWGFGPAPVG